MQTIKSSAIIALPNFAGSAFTRTDPAETTARQRLLDVIVP